jgi:DNA-binding winged helix-turn-helix (wHTH) protein
MLLSRPGELIMREQFQREIWGDKTFVDFERGLNFRIPPRRGYRVVAEVSAVPQPQVDPATPPPLSKDSEPVLPAGREFMPFLLVSMLALGVVAFLWLSPSHSLPRVLDIKQLTRE